MLRRSALLFAAALAAAACDSSPGERILSVDAEGLVQALLFHDNDRNSVFSSADQRLRGAAVDLMMRGDTELTPGGPTDTAGFRAFRVPVGRYTVKVQPSVLGDSMEVGPTAEFTVNAVDTLTVLVPILFKTVDVAEARNLTNGARRWVRGVVLNPPFAFGDSTVHITLDSMAIRIVNVRPQTNLVAGDSVLLLSRKATRDGQPVMIGGTPPFDFQVIAQFVPVPPPDSLTTLLASTADGGKRDARLVRVDSVTVSDTVTVSTNKVLTVDDGSGPLKVFLSQNIQNRNQYTPGRTLDVTGVLAPDSANSQWVLKPRSNADIVIRP